MNTLWSSPLVMMLILMALFLVPVWRILKRTGHSGWWSLIIFIPLVNLIGFWLLAYVKWPAVDGKSPQS